MNKSTVGAFIIGVVLLGIFVYGMMVWLNSTRESFKVTGIIEDVEYTSGEWGTSDLTTIKLKDGRVLVFEGTKRNLTIGKEYTISWYETNSGKIRGVTIEVKE